MLNVTLASPHRRGALTIFPLIAEGAPELPYTLMSDALEAGALRITEIGSGMVPELLATNAGTAVVLVLDGEQLVGARQNRTTNRSLLLPAKSETRIPVSCMEQGRWHFASDHFTSPKQSSPTSVRRQAREVEARHARSGAPVPQDVLAMAQGQVWEAIAVNADALGTRPATGALNELYHARGGDLDSWMGEFPLEPRQVGLLAFLGARPLGMDLLGCPTLYARLHARLLPGYVLDALGVRSRARTPEAADAQCFLDRVATARRVESPSVGVGRYSVLSGEVIGGELVDRESAVHLSAFPVGRGPREDRIAPPSRRRRR